jgi:hypothetical protein
VNQTIHIFMSTTLPGSIRIIKNEISVKFSSDILVFSELLAIVPGHCMQTFRNWLEQKRGS